MTAVPRPIADVTWLKGLRVVEVTTAVSAPLISRVLVELGAEVVKVESRAKLDVNRARIPRPSDPEGFPAEEAFQLLHESNAGKESVTLNLKTAEGCDLLQKLLGDADVFIENFVPGWLDRLGLSIDYLLQTFPRLIVLSASGYGQTGPMRQQRSYAPVMTSLAGIEGLIGYSNGDVTGCSALALADLNCTFNGLFLVLAALNGRESTGRGQYLDLSQIEAATGLAGEAFVSEQLGGEPAGPQGNRDPDGAEWLLAQAQGADMWVVARGVSDGALDPETERSAAGALSRDELLDRLRARGVEASPVLSPDEVARDRRFAERAFMQTVPHPHRLLADLTITSVPWHIEGAVPRVIAPAPVLGSSNSTILGRYVTPERLAELDEQGALS